MTGLSAAHVGIVDRGVIRPGAYRRSRAARSRDRCRPLDHRGSARPVGRHRKGLGQRRRRAGRRQGDAVFFRGRRYAGQLHDTSIPFDRRSTSVAPGRAGRGAGCATAARRHAAHAHARRPRRHAVPGQPRAVARRQAASPMCWRTSIYVVPMAGGAPRAVTAAGSSASDPYWSKDGGALYFLSDRSGDNQLWKLPLDGLRRSDAGHELRTRRRRARLLARRIAIAPAIQGVGPV